MSPRPPIDGSCAAVREEIRERWLARTLEGAAEGQGGPGSTAAPDPGRGSRKPPEGSPDQPPRFFPDQPPLDEHVETCPECRAEANELLFLDASLERSFRLLGERTPGPDESRMEETVRLLRGSVEAELIRRVRRPIRFLLWTAFYLFTLLASLTLAVAVIKALGN